MNYYTYNLNKYNIKIDIISKFLEEIIIEKDFNNTLIKISEELIQNNIINKIKDEIIKSVNIKINQLYIIADNLEINIKELLNNIQIRPLPNTMGIIYDLILNYTEIVYNQKNRFFFNVSDKSFNLIYDFIHNNLEPPLISIKDIYNRIEEKLLNELIKKIEEFPDYYELLRNKLRLDLIHNNISLFCNQLIVLFGKYMNILDKEYSTYINKLIHFTFINGLYTFDKPCNDSYCFINLENVNESEQRILEEKEKNY